MRRHLMRLWSDARRRSRRRAGDRAEDATPGTMVSFQCNLCGASNRVASDRLARETPSCAACGSTVRWRALVHLACEALLGGEIVVPEAKRHAEIAGLGLSDDACVAGALARVFDYTNTYFHTAPQLDITAIPESMLGRYDLVTASDVFEHVLPPVEIAFVNARRLLKPGGAFVFTVPFTLESDTIEHFPELFDFRVEKQRGRFVLHNRTRDGRTQTFDGLVFHGGPGTTLEMRVFSRAALDRHFAAAGFRAWRFAAEPCARFGIVWPAPWSVPIVAHA